MKTHKARSYLTVPLLALAAVLMVTALVPAWMVQANTSLAASAQLAPVTIYGNSLSSGWQDWSWNSTRNLSNTSPVQSGSASISVTISQAWGALYLHRGTPQSTSGYTHLEFYIHGGTSGGQRLSVIANKNTGKVYQVTAPANSWGKVSIPLSSLGSPASLSDLFWQDAKGSAQAKFYLNSISLVDNSVQPTATQGVSITATPTRIFLPTVTKTPTTVPANPTATPTARPTATQPPVSTAHFNTLPPGSPLPSDAQCAAAIKRRPENKGINKTYNATPGNQKLASDFFGGGDPRANTVLAARVTGSFTGTTDEILQWTACKWGIDEDIVRAQAAIESWWRQDTKGDWTSDASRCSPGHGLGVDGRAGQCPESWGILQNRYPYEQSSWPGINNSTAFNADTAYAEMRSCYEGYEWWLNTVERGTQYAAGDVWGCVGRWFAGRWHTAPAEDYIGRVKGYLNQRIWETASFQEP